MPERNQRQKAAVGKSAPDFTLSAHTGASITLSDYRGKQCVVVYFYPKDNTSGCTAESCAFRDSYQDFQDAGAEVLGISSDSLESHQGFATSHHLPFPLLSDPGGKVRKAYGVPATFGLIPGRVTYVIDKQGIIRHIFNAQFNPQAHIREALRVLENLER